MNRVSDFMLQTAKDLTEQKKINEKSSNLYIKTLWTLNNKEPFNNLSFLKNTEEINKILSTYKDNTIKTMLSAIVSVLSLYKDKPAYKKIYQYYYDKMMGKATEMKNEIDINEKTTAQKDNWITWDDVINARNILKQAVEQFKDNKLITPAQYDILLAYIVLLCYSDIPPRRNADFIEMYFIPSNRTNLDKSKNYLVWDKLQFLFNNYKTAKKYGTQIVEFDPKNNDGTTKELYDALIVYLKFHPLNPSPNLKKLPKNTEFKFLVYSDGSPMVAVNSITRILNKIFNKKIGSSMLRHIYLSSKYNINEMMADAEAMGHSLNEQRQYLKEDDINTEDEVPTPKEPKTPKPTKEPKNINKFKMTTI
jgi:hypothetical protein